MNLSEVNWDFNVAGSWPLPIKIATIVLVSIFVAGVGIYYITIDQLNELDQFEIKETELKKSFKNKQKKAINLVDYREQLTQIEVSLGEMIKQMPTQAEVANLLIDISQTGLASGLEFRLFKPAATIRKDFYSELPIDIKVIGKYEEIGLFVSGLASLPRIVTVHNVAISPNKESKDKDSKSKDSLLTMNAIIKTYNEESGVIKKKKKNRRK
ncbi:MAG: type 4a pilus biogenesis protein PilO [Methylococcales bacterium]|nr:type 4a pilus biogenesis protein PilO [Methylococcales bacterium]